MATAAGPPRPAVGFEIRGHPELGAEVRLRRAIRRGLWVNR
jgi:hypothetical protein